MPISVPSIVRRAIGNIIDPEDIQRLYDVVVQLDGALTGAESTVVLDAVAPGTDGQIKGTVDGEVANMDHRAHTGITVAAEDSPLWMRQMADFNPSYSGSDVDRWQAAIDQAQTYLAAITPPSVILGTGTYHLDDTITAKSCAIVSAEGVPGSVQVYWDGGIEPVIVKDGAYNGTSSWWRMSGVSFNEGTGYPSTWLDFSDTFVDAQCQLDWVQFAGGLRQITLGDGFVNAHWSHLRFDAYREYGLYIAPSASQFLGSFSLDQFTADNYRVNPSETGKAFIGIEMPENGVEAGIISLSNARIEFPASLQAPNALVHIIRPAANDTGNVVLGLDAVTIHTEIGGANGLSCLVYEDSPSADRYPAPVTGRAVAVSQSDLPIYAGDLISTVPVRNLPQRLADVVAMYDRQSILSTDVRHYQGSEDVVMATKESITTNSRFSSGMTACTSGAAPSRASTPTSTGPTPTRSKPMTNSTRRVGSRPRSRRASRPTPTPPPMPTARS
jgi:hypothetical protein